MLENLKRCLDNPLHVAGHILPRYGIPPDGDPVGYQWQFGDGTNGAGAIVSHVYTDCRPYFGELTVTDGVLSNSAAVTGAAKAIAACTPNQAAASAEASRPIIGMRCSIVL